MQNNSRRRNLRTGRSKLLCDRGLLSRLLFLMHERSVDYRSTSGSFLRAAQDLGWGAFWISKLGGTFRRRMWVWRVLAAVGLYALFVRYRRWSDTYDPGRVRYVCMGNMESMFTSTISNQIFKEEFAKFPITGSASPAWAATLVVHGPPL